MRTRQHLPTTFSILLIVALLAACGSPAAAPTSTEVPPTATTVPPTPTPIAPTVAPAPPTSVVEPETTDATLEAAAMPEPIGMRPDAPPYAVHGPYWVGYKSVVIGEGTDHPLQAGLWYPALNPEGDKEEITYAMPWKIPSMPLDTEPVAYGHALRDAAVDNSAAPYPLVIFSPGFGAAAPWYSNLIEHYASYGFVVLAPDHIEEWDPEYGDIWKASIDRPRDIKQTLDYAQEVTSPNGELAGMIDMQNVAVEGHSYGGYTAMAMAGAEYDLDAFNARCAALPPDDPNTFLCKALVRHEADMAVRAGLDPMPEGLWPSLGDPRVTAIIPIAGDSYLFDKVGLSKITIPMMAIGGTADTSTPYEWGVRPAYDNASSAKKVLVTLDGAEHTITTSCENLPWMYDTPFGGWICFDPVWDKDRGMDLINHFSTAFLLDTLKGDTEAAKALVPENVSFPNIQYETTSYGVAQNAAAEAEEESHGLRPDAPPYAVHGQYAVGTREFTVETAGRTVPVTVWYPALNPDGRAEEITYSMDVGDQGLPQYPVLGNAILDAPSDMSGAPYPLVVWSHGGYLYRQSIVYLAEHLASQGFVVVAGNHEDNWGTFPASNATSNVSRPADISAWIDFAEEQTAAGSELAGLIDAEHIAVGGQSFGGYTALAAAGALFNPTWYLDVVCADNILAEDDPLNDCSAMEKALPELASLAGLDAVPEGLWPSWQDPRVDAIFLLAPSSVFGAEGAATVTIPTMSLTGSADPLQDVALHVYLTYENLGSANKSLVVFQNGGHTMFLNDCNSATGMANVAFEWCSDSVWDTDRVHDLTNHFATAFLLAELKGDSEAAKALAPENVTFPGIEYETTAYGAMPMIQIPPVETGYAEVNGTRLYYEMAGAGEPIVMIHGLGWDTRSWDNQFAELAQQYQVMRYDMRGFGQSDMPTDQPYAHADDLKALLEYLEIDAAHIFGHSFGGEIAINFALAYPEATRSLVLIEPDIQGAQGLPDLTPEEEASFAAVFEALDKGDNAAAGLAIVDMHPLVAVSRNVPGVRELILQVFTDYQWWQFLNENPVVQPDPSSAERIGEIAAPMLLVVGNATTEYQKIEVDRLAEQAPNAEKVVFENSDHFPHLLYPQEFNALVLDFLARVSGRQ